MSCCAVDFCASSVSASAVAAADGENNCAVPYSSSLSDVSPYDIGKGESIAGDDDDDDADIGVNCRSVNERIIRGGPSCEIAPSMSSEGRRVERRRVDCVVVLCCRSARTAVFGESDAPPAARLDFNIGAIVRNAEFGVNERDNDSADGDMLGEKVALTGVDGCECGCIVGDDRVEFARRSMRRLSSICGDGDGVNAGDVDVLDAADGADRVTRTGFTTAALVRSPALSKVNCVGACACAGSAASSLCGECGSGVDGIGVAAC